MKKCKTGDMKQGRVNRTVWSKATYLEEASLQTTALGSERLGIEACIGSSWSWRVESSARLHVSLVVHFFSCKPFNPLAEEDYLHSTVEKQQQR